MSWSLDTPLDFKNSFLHPVIMGLQNIPAVVGYIKFVGVDWSHDLCYHNPNCIQESALWGDGGYDSWYVVPPSPIGGAFVIGQSGFQSNNDNFNHQACTPPHTHHLLSLVNWLKYTTHHFKCEYDVCEFLPVENINLQSCYNSDKRIPICWHKED